MNSTISSLGPKLTGIDTRARYFSTLLWGVLLSLTSIPWFVFSAKSPWFLLLAGVWLVLVWSFAWHFSKRWFETFGYALLDDGIWIESGVFWRGAKFVPRARVQHTEVNHGPIDRKMGLAKLSINTAGIHDHSVTIYGVTLAHANLLRDELLKRQIDSQALTQQSDAGVSAQELAQRTSWQ